MNEQDLLKNEVQERLSGFNETVEGDLQGREKYLEDGYFEFVMKPLENKEIFETTAKIVDGFKPIKINSCDMFPFGIHQYDSDPANYAVKENEWHASWIMDSSYDVFSVFKDGSFVLRRSYLKSKLYFQTPHIIFPDMIGFVTESLMLAKQFYSGRLGKDEKIVFEWRFTKTQDRELVPPNNSWRFRGICKTDVIIEKRVYKYEDLDKYMFHSKEVVGEICKQFGWMNGISYVDDFNKEFIGYFDK